MTASGAQTESNTRAHPIRQKLRPLRGERREMATKEIDKVR